MDLLLLETKLYVPHRRPVHVARARLIAQLDEGFDRGQKLTVVSAPAGFGKTTLVSEWARNHPTAWLSLDASDNDVARFVAYLVAALRQAKLDVGQDTLVALESSTPPAIESLLISLINEMAALYGEDERQVRRHLLVLDDYHLITLQSIHDGVIFMLDHLPRNVHLVVVIRADPPLPMARLRGQGQLTELRQADLRFTTSEAAAFLNARLGLVLSVDDVAMLEARTEGRITGLQMASLALQARLSQTGTLREQQEVADFLQAFAGSDRYVLDYLIEEVLQRQPVQVQKFLLQTAVLDRLTGPLCDALTESSDRSGTEIGQDMLEWLERANLFVVPLDRKLGLDRWVSWTDTVPEPYFCPVSALPVW
jgi:LuxR family maltose regulon positive regulatory protein